MSDDYRAPTGNGGPALWVWWVLAHAVSYFVGNVVPSEVVSPVVAAVGAGRVAGISHVAISGLSLGLLQGLILRRYIIQADRWMWATIGGLGLLGSVSALVSLLALEAIDRELTFFWAGAMVFLLLFLMQLAVVGGTGLLQWLILRMQVQRAGRWITATVAAHLLGMVAGIGVGFIPYLFHLAEVDGGIGVGFIPYRFHLLEVAYGVVVGAVTGVVLVRLLRQPAAGGRTAAA